jgi:hypothetical protein
MFRKRDRSSAPAPEKPATPPDDSFEAGLRAELRRENKSAFKAKLAVAEQTNEWRRFKQQFKRIADKQEQVKAPSSVPPAWKDVVAKKKKNDEWERFVAKYAPPPRPPSPSPSPPSLPSPWLGTVEAWLLGFGVWRGAFFEYPPQSNEKIWAPLRLDDYCRRIGREARKVGLSPKASYIKKVYPRRVKAPK